MKNGASFLFFWANVIHSSMCLLVICISSLEECPVRYFDHLKKIGCFFCCFKLIYTPILGTILYCLDWGVLWLSFESRRCESFYFVLLFQVSFGYSDSTAIPYEFRIGLVIYVFSWVSEKGYLESEVQFSEYHHVNTVNP